MANDLPDGPPVPIPPAPPAPPAPGPLNWRRFVPTNWQSVVGTAAITAVIMLLNYFKFTPEPIPVPEPPFPIWQGNLSGWVPPSEQDINDALASKQVYRFADTDAAAGDPVGDKDGNAYLWNLARNTRGEDVPTLNQLRVGSCVGQGWATVLMYRIAVQAYTRQGSPIEPKIDIAAEVIYGGSRVNANGGRTPLPGDGSNGSWAARFVTTDGAAGRGVYGPYDVSEYSESNCRALGRSGIKGELLEACRKNIVGSAALVTSVDEAKKCLRQGMPIAVCSSVGFDYQPSRDANGRLAERGVWPHCMACIGHDAKSDTFCIMNSWGPNWVKGPSGPGNPPPGSFWILSKTFEKMLKAKDSYAVSDQQGFPRQKIRVDDWLVRDNVRPAKIKQRPPELAGRWVMPFALSP